MQSAGEERGRACPSPSFYSEVCQDGSVKENVDEDVDNSDVWCINESDGQDEGGGGRQGRDRQSRPTRPNSTCELYSR